MTGLPADVENLLYWAMGLLFVAFVVWCVTGPLRNQEVRRDRKDIDVH